MTITRILFACLCLLVLHACSSEERWEHKSGACAKCEPILPRDIHAQRLAAANSKCYPYCSSVVGKSKVGKIDVSILPSRQGREMKDPKAVNQPNQSTNEPTTTPQTTIEPTTPEPTTPAQTLQPTPASTPIPTPQPATVEPTIAPVLGAAAILNKNNGPIMTETIVTSIFWGSRWSDPNYVKDKISSVDDFFNGVRDSDYLKVIEQYGGSNGRINTTFQYNGHIVDSQAATGLTTDGDTQFGNLVNEICSVIGTDNIDPLGRSFITVFVDVARPPEKTFCGCHSYSQCGNRGFKFAFIWDQTSDSGCTARDYTTRSNPAASIVNLASHELVEAMTDPKINSWIDSQGLEVADKCCWRFSSYVTLSTGRFKLQQLWSNDAYATGSGMNDGTNNYGCVSPSNQ